MIIIYPPSNHLYDPKYEVVSGEKVPHHESAVRIKSIMSALRKEGFTLKKVSKLMPLSSLLKIHDAEYVKFIKTSSQEAKIDEWRYPSIFSRVKNHQVAKSLINQGFYSFDTYTPIGSKTYQAAIESASAAYRAAIMIKRLKSPVSYAVCRPPGHHAESSRMGGYCYFNNAAVAADYLSVNGKVVVLDVDFHHGNGTQQIFFNRKDVLTISIHADPALRFPYYYGFENEIGIEDGKGFNRNYPLPMKVNNWYYHKVLLRAINTIVRYNPKYLVIGLGIDGHKDDPIGEFKLTTKYYNRMAKAIASLKIPTVIVQEGGYNVKILGRAVISFLNGFKIKD